MEKGEVNPDLAEERHHASFDVLSMTRFLDGGQKNTIRRRHIQKLVVADRDFDGPEYAFLSKEQQYEDGIRKATLQIIKCKNHGITDPNDIATFQRMVFPNEVWSMNFHGIAFLPPLIAQATDEQLTKWKDLIESGEMIGAYVQTELSHGTSIKHLGTTATYDTASDEFVLNTPNFLATKWWAGGLGKTATFALVMARLVTNGRTEGIHPFVVPLRDLNTHMPLPGVHVGDIGPKYGVGENDNGFLQFRNVRIPRENMLMKYAKVLKDGTYLRPVNSKLVYAGMINLRCSIPSDVAYFMAKVITVAIRYSCVRRQSELQPGKSEAKILEYQTQQQKLFPVLAEAYATWFVSRFLSHYYQECSKKIQKGDFSQLPELHALSAGLKAMTTTRGGFAVEVCRLACGGHGYSLASGMQKPYVLIKGATTAEGESTVMLLQTARYLLRCVDMIDHGKPLDPSAAYLAQVNVSNPRWSGDTSPTSLLSAYQTRAGLKLKSAADRVKRLVVNGQAIYDALNRSSVDLLEAAQTHIECVTMNEFVKAIGTEDLPKQTSGVLRTLCELHAIHGLLLNPTALLQVGYVTSDQLDALQERQMTLYQKIRPDAVALVDAFDIPDRALDSVLGRYDGLVYENLYKWAKASPLNQTEVHPSFKKYVRPFREAMAAKL